MITTRCRHVLALALTAGAFAPTAAAQVHYHADGRPWSQRADRGPDADVPGWFYNLGITGIRAELVAEAPTHLVVRHVFERSPAAGRVRTGDHIVGAGGRAFETPHRNGYGMEVFGPAGPILDFANALEAAQGAALGRTLDRTLDRDLDRDRGTLALTIERGGQRVEVELPVGRRYGSYAAEYPNDCPKSERILDELCDYLLQQQRDDGSWGHEVPNTFAPLALLATGEAKYLSAVEKCARWHARTTQAEDASWLINWRYTAAALVLSEFYLATGERWVLPELAQIHAFLLSSQYTDPAQIHPKTREERPQDLPKPDRTALGGWGHNPGFEGYGPIAMLTGQGALALALMHRCGVEIDGRRLRMAYDFLGRGTGTNGYVWYADDVAGNDRWADMGRTGASGIAHFLSPFDDESHRQRALAHARVIGLHPESFPDTHGSPLMGMGYAAMAAATDAASYRRLMDANRWWFAMAQCGDKTFYYQPNRDNAGYGGDARLKASAVAAFLLVVPRATLAVTGRSSKK